MKFIISGNCSYSEQALVAETIRVLDQLNECTNALEMFNESDSIWLGSPSGIRFFLKYERDDDFGMEELEHHQLYDAFVLSEPATGTLDASDWRTEDIYSFSENIDCTHDAIVIVQAFESTFERYFTDHSDRPESERYRGIDKNVMSLVDGHTSLRIASSLLGIDPEQLLGRFKGEAFSRLPHDWMLEGMAEQIDQYDPLDSRVDFLKIAYWAYFERFVNGPKLMNELMYLGCHYE